MAEKEREGYSLNTGKEEKIKTLSPQKTKVHQRRTICHGRNNKMEILSAHVGEGKIPRPKGGQQNQKSAMRDESIKVP